MAKVRSGAIVLFIVSLPVVVSIFVYGLVICAGRAGMEMPGYVRGIVVGREVLRLQCSLRRIFAQDDIRGGMRW